MKRWAIVLMTAALIVPLSLPVAEGATLETVPESPEPLKVRQDKKTHAREATGDVSSGWIASKIACSDSPYTFANTMLATLRQASPQAQIEIMNDLSMLGFINYRYMNEGKQLPEANVGETLEAFFIELHAVCPPEGKLSIADIMRIKRFLIEKYPHYYQEYVTHIEPDMRDTLTRIVKEKEQPTVDDLIKKRQKDIKKITKDLSS